MKIWERDLPVGILAIYNQRPEFDFFEVNQVHGNAVYSLNEINNGVTQADGIYCLKDDERPMAIKTADCLPIWACGENGVALLHAGWRGVAANIFSPENLKDIKPFYFFIGPAIESLHYEVQPDFVDNFSHLDQCFTHRDQKIYFELKLAAQTLLSRQFPSAKIEVSPLDTFSSPELHSYRKDKTSERNWNLWLPSPLPV